MQTDLFRAEVPEFCADSELDNFPIEYLGVMPLPVTIEFGPSTWVMTTCSNRLKVLQAGGQRPFDLAQWARCISWEWTARDYAESWKWRPKEKNPFAPKAGTWIWKQTTRSWTRYPPTIGGFLKQSGCTIRSWTNEGEQKL